MPWVLVSLLLVGDPTAPLPALPAPDPMLRTAAQPQFIESCLGALLEVCLEVVCEVCVEDAVENACDLMCDAPLSSCDDDDEPKPKPRDDELGALWDLCRPEVLAAVCRADDPGCEARLIAEYRKLPRGARVDWLIGRGCPVDRLRGPLGGEPDLPPPITEPPAPPPPPAGDPPPGDPPPPMLEPPPTRY